MKIVNLKFYGGARQKVCRLGLSHLFLELQEIIINTQIRVLKEKQGNSAGVVREQIDSGFRKANKSYAQVADHWKQRKTGGIDWIKRIRYNRTIVSRLGVEIQVSGRSDLLSRDIVHIRNELQDGNIDVGVIVVPADEFEYFLTDRVANYSYAIRYAETELREAQNYPIIIFGIEQDGFSDKALPKKRTNLGGSKKA